MRQGSFGLVAAVVLATAFLALWPTEATAQFKWREADGRIAYGDRVPDRPVKLLKAPKGYQSPGARSASANSANALPYELRLLNQRYPVTLYTTSACAPCDLARTHLKQRGVPFKERTVKSRQDIEAFEALGFPPGTGLPVVTVGAERQIGYHEPRWTALFDTTGYPEKSRLPVAYQAESPAPLAASVQPKVEDLRDQRAVLGDRSDQLGGFGATNSAPSMRF